MQHQAVGGDQQHLEEHEQVEQVAGEEGAVDAQQLELEQRVEMAAALVPAADGGRARRRAPARPVSSSIVADSRSSTSTMPNGAGQSPSR